MNRVKNILNIGIVFVMTTAASLTSATTVENAVTIVNPETLYDPAPYGYSHAVVSTGHSKIAYIAGQGGEYKSGALPQDFSEQVRQAYQNLSSALDAVGATPKEVTKLTTYVVNYDQTMLAVMTERLVEMFGTHLPAQTLVPVPRLALDGMLFEVDAIAVLK